MIVILLALLVFADFVIGFLGDELFVIIQQIKLILEFYVQFN